MDKGEAKDDLVALRREVCARFIREPGYRFVELADPSRAKTGDYRQAVADWHAARADVWARALLDELPDGGVGAFLAWGDPSLYDSTLRILDLVAARIDVSYDVVPGITAIQALTARHRIPLNDIGEPVLITTGRRLREEGLTGAASSCSTATVPSSVVPPRLGSGGAPTSARRTSSWRPARSARWASRSPRCGRRRGSGTVGSWTRIC
jgi:precorrin-6A synthase